MVSPCDPCVNGGLPFCGDLYSSTHVVSPVKVISAIEGGYTTLRISWEAVSGAVSYKVYGSPCPMNMNLLTPTAITDLFFEYDIPQAPEDVVWHFWVGSLDGVGVETLISVDGATLQTSIDPFNPENNPQTTDFGCAQIPDDMMNFYFNEIRRRTQALLDNDGEEFLVFMRRWSGRACPKQDERISSDPDYDSMHKHDLCYGTGILGGYCLSLTLKFRYGDSPPRKINFTESGIELGHDFNSWTIWLPKLHEHDIVIRKSTGERFKVADISESSWRGLPLRQQLKLLTLQPGDIRQLVNDTGITAAMTHANDPFERPTIWG